MSLNDLYELDSVLDPKTENLDPKTTKKSPSKPKKIRDRSVLDPKTENLDPKIKSAESDLKVLDLKSLWGEICVLRNDSQVMGLFGWLANKKSENLLECVSDDPRYYRSNAASGVITLFRHLKREGYV